MIAAKRWLTLADVPADMLDACPYHFQLMGGPLTISWDEENDWFFEAPWETQDTYAAKPGYQRVAIWTPDSAEAAQ